MQVLDLQHLGDLAAALLIGALVGLEREKRKADEDLTATSGIRTFILVAIVGAVASWMSQVLETPWLFAAGLLAVTACAVAGYVAERRVNPKALGLTSETAAMVVYLLAGTAMAGQREIAMGLAVIAATTMAFKGEIHGLVAKIGRDDLYAVLRLLIATLIILPLLPDQTIDPLGAVNPHSAWLLVILISSLSFVGYVAVRWLGNERGLVATGMAGGLVSSTAVTLAFSRQSRERSGAAMGDALAAGVLASWAVMFARVMVAVAVVYPLLLQHLWIPLVALTVVSALLAAIFFQRGRTASAASSAAASESVTIRNPFSLTSAMKFAAFFVAILVVVKLVQQHAPGDGLYAVAVLAGTTDVDAITLSMASAARDGADPAMSTTVIVLALLSNTLAKCGIAAVLGGAALRHRLLLCTGIVLAVAAVAALIAR